MSTAQSPSKSRGSPQKVPKIIVKSEKDGRPSVKAEPGEVNPLADAGSPIYISSDTGSEDNHTDAEMEDEATASTPQDGAEERSEKGDENAENAMSMDEPRDEGEASASAGKDPLEDSLSPASSPLPVVRLSSRVAGPSKSQPQPRSKEPISPVRPFPGALSQPVPRPARAAANHRSSSTQRSASSQPKGRGDSEDESRNTKRARIQAHTGEATSPPISRARPKRSKAALMRQRHADYWHLDGSVVVQIQSTVFRLHRSRLAQQSTYFARLFRSGQAEVVTGSAEPPELDIVDGCPVYKVQGVSVGDFEKLLTSLDKAMTYIFHPPAFSELAAILRAASALEFDIPLEFVTHKLREMWPSDLAKLTAQVIPNASETILLAKRCDMPELLKRAYYELLRTGGLGQDEYDSEGEGDSAEETKHLPRSDLVLLIKAREQLALQWLLAAGSPPSWQVFPCPLEVPAADSEDEDDEEDDIDEDKVAETAIERMKFLDCQFGQHDDDSETDGSWKDPEEEDEEDQEVQGGDAEGDAADGANEVQDGEDEDEEDEDEDEDEDEQEAVFTDEMEDDDEEDEEDHDDDEAAKGEKRRKELRVARKLTRSKCVEARAASLQQWEDLVRKSGLYEDCMYDPLCGLQRLIDIDWAKEGYCEGCVQVRRETWAKTREKIWDHLDIWLELSQNND